MPKDVEHLFMCFSDIQYSSVEHSLFNLYPILIGLFGSLNSYLLRYLHILDISPLLDVGVIKIFFNSVVFTLLIDAIVCVMDDF